ncbi:hypothetical protein QFC19_003062 [Naganishia cerealis]|uniref:Uncharacterized protein n=1 Tax=Naganishia cerealis TaxID=610337 RepID=A0ACC2W4T0_9TREE|nr:hypothetical protein QFC19_003062 [Naganishia cerealis]
MANHGPIHLPAEEDNKTSALMPKVTTGIVISEVVRTATLAGAAGAQIYSAIWARKHSLYSGNERGLPNRFDLRIWFALGTWQFQVTSAACLTAGVIASVYLASSRRHTLIRKSTYVLVNTMLLILFFLNAYRNVYPKATYFAIAVSEPQWVAWTLSACLTNSAVFVPLFQPRPAPYSYINPDEISDSDKVATEASIRDPTPHPQLTASLFSATFYSFMDPVLLRAFRSSRSFEPTFSANELPPTRPQDRSKRLEEEYMSIVDPIARRQRGLKERSLVINLLSAFKNVSMVMAGMMVIKATAEFLSPIALERLLSYIERDGEEAVFRPWIWIVLLFIGPVVSSIATQCYGLLSDDAAKITSPVLPASAREPELIPDLSEEQPAKGHEVTESATGEIPAAINGPQMDADSEEKKPEKQASLVGRIITLMTADIDQMMDGRDIFLVAVYCPLQIVLGTIFLYQILSWSALVGMLVTFITLPIPGMLAKLLNTAQADLMKVTDKRVQAVSEALTTLRLVKTFAWEEKVMKQLSAKRDAEIKAIKRTKVLSSVIGGVVWMLPVIPMALSYGLYVGVEHKALTAAKVFSSVSVFDMIRSQGWILMDQAQKLITVNVSLQRFDEFVRHTRLLARFDLDKSGSTAQYDKEEELTEEHGICIRHCDFAWQTVNDSEAVGTSRQFAFRLTVGTLEFPLGQTTLINGPTGCGKTSLLMALLGEMEQVPRNVEACVHLPRAQGVALCMQNAWVMEGTVKDNIVFGSLFDEARYRKVLHQCALTQDLALWDAGDQTELGEKGLTASGGQKARISLARAVYSSSPILLLDDVLAALDLHTTKFIVDKLFRGDLLEGRTVIVVTHHVSLMKPVSDFVISISPDGVVGCPEPIDRTEHPGSNSETSSTIMDSVLLDENKGLDVIHREPTGSGKLLIGEDKAQGKVSRRTILQYFASAGGFFYWTIYFSDIVLGEVLFAYCNLWLGIWSRAYEGTDPSKVSAPYYLGIYVALMLLQISAYCSSSLIWTFGCLRASRDLHRRLATSVLRSTLRWLDTTPTGNMISRFTKDIKSCDSALTRVFQGFSELTVTLAMKFVLLIWMVPAFAPLALAVGFVGGLVGEFYVRAQMDVKRETSNAKSPLYSQFAAAISGIVSIRAYGSETRLQAQLQKRADHYTRCATAMYNLNRWINIRVDVLGAIFSSGLAIFLVYGSNNFDPVFIGFGLNQAVSVSEIILHWVKLSNEFEVQCNSIERINEFLSIDKEPEAIPKNEPPASWPTSGEIVFSNVSARYFKGGPQVLKDVSLRIQSGSRVGIIGRTGSGKSTLALALLRLIPLEGSISISGQDTKQLNLPALRKSVMSIPQEPTLLAGTLRTNLDPFDEYDDADLYEALKISGLGTGGASLRDEAQNSSTAKLTLESEIASGGSNLSQVSFEGASAGRFCLLTTAIQGQRQLVSLARALVRNSKILILDEATASVDFQTDHLVQQAIRNLHGVTILTIAHRLSTIMDYDFVLVLGDGMVLEYDTPKALLANSKGLLRALVDSSAEKEELERLAGYTA